MNADRTLLARTCRFRSCASEMPIGRVDHSAASKRCHRSQTGRADGDASGRHAHQASRSYRSMQSRFRTTVTGNRPVAFPILPRPARTGLQRRQRQKVSGGSFGAAWPSPGRLPGQEPGPVRRELPYATNQLQYALRLEGLSGDDAVMSQGFHEQFDRSQEVKHSSNRTFGIVFAVFFLLVALFPLLKDGQPRIWSMVVAGLFLAMAFAAPRYLAPLNRLWARFGDLLHRVANPIILGLIFFVVVMPVALIMRVIGKDPLDRRANPSANTYWVKRRVPGPPPQSMRDQF